MVLLGKGSASCYVFKPSLEWPPPADLRCHSSVVRNSSELSAKCSRPLCCDQPLADRLPNSALQLLRLSRYKTKPCGNCLHVMLCKGRWRRYLQTACLSEGCHAVGGERAPFPWIFHCVSQWILVLKHLLSDCYPNTAFLLFVFTCLFHENKWQREKSTSKGISLSSV